MPEWLTSLSVGSVVAWLVVGCGAWVTLVPLRKLVRAIDQFVEDWAGQPARPGVAAIPGVMEQLADLRDEMQQTRAAATDAAYNSKANHGHSAYDELMKELRGVKKGVAESVRESVEDRKQLHEQLDALTESVNQMQKGEQ